MQDSYRDLFLTESQEYLTNIGNCLIKLEEDQDDSGAINEIFRCVHTLKGMSATMGFDKLAQLSHQMEDLLDEVRNKRKNLDSKIVDSLFTCLDTLEQLLVDIRANRDSHIDISGCMDSLKKILSGEEKAGMQEAPQEVSLEFSDKESETAKDFAAKGFSVFKVEITLSSDCVMKEARAYLVLTNLKKMGEVIKSSPCIDDLKEGKFGFSFSVILATKETKDSVRQELFAISEIDGANVSPAQVSAQPQGPGAKQEATIKAAEAVASYIRKIQSIRVPVERVDKIMNIMGELAIARIRLSQVVRSYKLDPLSELSFSIDRLISLLQDEIMQTRLLPVAYVLDAFPRIVRDLARKEDKEVDLEISGSEIELDRVVLDEISDPLVHLVRNAIDHGIETPQQRKEAKKSVRAKLSINVIRQKGQIFIEVVDDGQGVDFTAVGKQALSKGLISKEEAANLDGKKVLEIISLPGFSTAKKVTDVSGRGVGLDAVKAKIDALGGRVDFETKRGEGSRFILTLPLTLAIIKAMLVRVENETFAIPLMSIRETVKIKAEEFKVLQNFEVIRVRDEVIPTIRLNKELGVAVSASAQEAARDKKLSVVIVEHGNKAIGLVVTQVLGEQDIVVKPLTSVAKKTKGIAGATILGDGRVALILDIMSLR